MMALSTLTTENISASFGTRKILSDISLAPLQAGRLNALLGANAAGKSTLL
jgi:iron complex transport system ATP-binding protein